jgi:hypothetical protein
MGLHTRVFLTKFSLHGEADATDRILNAFAKHFHTQNPAGSLTADQAYFLAAATVLLNGDLHNPVWEGVGVLTPHFFIIKSRRKKRERERERKKKREKRCDC